VLQWGFSSKPRGLSPRRFIVAPSTCEGAIPTRGGGIGEFFWYANSLWVNAMVVGLFRSRKSSATSSSSVDVVPCGHGVRGACPALRAPWAERDAADLAAPPPRKTGPGKVQGPWQSFNNSTVLNQAPCVLSQFDRSLHQSSLCLSRI